jgi:hypothetical protein
MRENYNHGKSKIRDKHRNAGREQETIGRWGIQPPHDISTPEDVFSSFVILGRRVNIRYKDKKNNGNALYAAEKGAKIWISSCAACLLGSPLLTLCC